jgi:hypothetical protein
VVAVVVMVRVVMAREVLKVSAVVYQLLAVVAVVVLTAVTPTQRQEVMVEVYTLTVC